MVILMKVFINIMSLKIVEEFDNNTAFKGKWSSKLKVERFIE